MGQYYLRDETWALPPAAAVGLDTNPSLFLNSFFNCYQVLVCVVCHKAKRFEKLLLVFLNNLA